MQGIINAFDMPGRQSFMVQMVEDKRDLSNAIAINSSMVNMARLVGPSLAGMLIAVTSEGWCFLIDGISYMAVIASLLMMHLARGPAAAQSRIDPHRSEGRLDLRLRVPADRTILLLFAVVSLMGMPFVVLMPIFAAKVLHGRPAHARLSDGRNGCGSLHLRARARRAQEREGAGAHDPHGRGRLRFRAHRLRAVARLLAFDDHGA
jgi:MFS family permease